MFAILFGQHDLGVGSVLTHFSVHLWLFFTCETAPMGLSTRRELLEWSLWLF